jgi:ribose transport system permease protein
MARRDSIGPAPTAPSADATSAAPTPTARRMRGKALSPRLPAGLDLVDLTPLAVIVALLIIGAVFSPYFFTASNLTNVLTQVSVIGIVTMAQTILLVAAGIDLSVGNNVAVSGVVTGELFSHGTALWLACLAGIGCGTLIGLVNGVLVAQNRAHPFIITLGMFTLLDGVATKLTGGSPVNDMGALNTTLGGTLPGGIPTAIIVLLVAVVAVALFLHRSPIGRAAYAIGGNEEASYLSGIPIKRTKIYLYTIVGFIVGIAALVESGILNEASNTIAPGLELQSIAAAVIGGTPLFGGRGGALRSLQGVILLGLISNILNLLGLGGDYRNIVTGIIVIIAVMVQKLR